MAKERVNELDCVLLEDGREAAVVSVRGDQEAFLVDVGTSSADWETIMVTRDQIVKITYRA